MNIEKYLNNKLVRVEMNGVITYFSYETPIIMIVKDEWFVRDSYLGYSNTTNRHFHFVLDDNQIRSNLNETEWSHLEHDPFEYQSDEKLIESERKHELERAFLSKYDLEL